MSTTIPTFVAVDGEGITREDGTHDYTLLAASTGAYIETDEIGGLSTEQCFDFLLSLSGTVIGFYFSYDSNMILRDLPRAQLERLNEVGSTIYRSLETGRKFRVEYIPNRLLIISEGRFVDDVIKGQSWRSYKSVHVWDTSRFFQTSFVNALKDWHIGDDATVERIATMKNKRSDFADESADQVREYCMEECALLVELMTAVAKTLESVDMLPRTWLGAGSIASLLLRRNVDPQTMGHELDDEFLRAANAAYYGGRIETFGVGLLTRRMHNYDINSAYPYACTTLPAIGSTWEHHKGFRYDPYALHRVKWASPSDAQYGPLPYRHKQHIYYPLNGEGIYHACEVYAAQRAGFDVTIRETWIPEYDDTIHPFSWLKPIYDERRRMKAAHDPREKVLKYPLNAIYGKLAQRDASHNRIPPYRSLYHAGYVTAYCRSMILDAISKAPRDSIISIATDGIISREPLHHLHVGVELGHWSQGTYRSGLVVVQPGFYMEPPQTESTTEKPTKRTRGFNPKHILYDQLIDLWTSSRFHGELNITETIFVGYPLALHTKLEHWRRWMARPKRVVFGASSRWIPPDVLFASTNWARLVPYHRIDGPNEPYNKQEATTIAKAFDELAHGIDLNDDSLFGLELGEPIILEELKR